MKQLYRTSSVLKTTSCCIDDTTTHFRMFFDLAKKKKKKTNKTKTNERSSDVSDVESLCFSRGGASVLLWRSKTFDLVLTSQKSPFVSSYYHRATLLSPSKLRSGDPNDTLTADELDDDDDDDNDNDDDIKAFQEARQFKRRSQTKCLGGWPGVSQESQCHFGRLSNRDTSKRVVVLRLIVLKRVIMLSLDCFGARDGDLWWRILGLSSSSGPLTMLVW